MILCINGSRNFDDYDLFVRVVDTYLTGKTVEMIISGGASGADTFAEKYALERGIPFRLYPAEWKKYGKRAGFLRNNSMALNCTHLLSFWDGCSKGTRHTIDRCRELHRTVSVFRYDLKEYEI